MAEIVTHHNVEWDDARHIAFDIGTQLGTEIVPTSSCVNRVLSSDLVTAQALPPNHTAMMDGYAVRGNGPWKVIGEVRAGQYVSEIHRGEALRVSTGAHIPEATSFVIPQEDAEVNDSVVSSTRQFDAGKHVRLPGDEAKANELIARAGTLITPPIAGLASSAGADEVIAYAIPTVSVIVSGDELIQTGIGGNGKIRDSLSIQVAEWATYLGAQVTSSAHCPDTFEATVAALTAATGNIIVTTGGTAHGPHDYFRPAITELGGTLIIDEINARPGHPSVLAVLPNGQFIACLPGNPLAALVCFMTIVEPLLLKLSGRGLPALDRAQLHTHSPSEHTRVTPVAIHDGVATPSEFRGSAMLRGLVNANALAVIRKGANNPGTGVDVLPLPWRTL